MNPTLTIILISIGLIAVIFLIRYLVNIGANKAEDAIRNAKKRSDEKKNPPQQESLADRYKNME